MATDSGDNCATVPRVGLTELCFGEITEEVDFSEMTVREVCQFLSGWESNWLSLQKAELTRAAAEES